jgi:hypothetical protein
MENEDDSAGYNTWAYNIVTMLAEREWHKTNFNRAPNDALRVSSIMMDAKYRNQMEHVMSNVKEEPAGLGISGISETAIRSRCQTSMISTLPKRLRRPI